MILDLLINDGLRPGKVASTNGGEYSSPCLECGGRDRFRSWPEQDRYWCRQCGKSGDSIQYLRDFHGMSFSEATQQVGKPLSLPSKRKIPARKKARPKALPAEWSIRAGKLTDHAHKALLENFVVLAWLRKERGLNVETVKRQ